MRNATHIWGAALAAGLIAAGGAAAAKDAPAPSLTYAGSAAKPFGPQRPSGPRRRPIAPAQVAGAAHAQKAPYKLDVVPVDAETFAHQQVLSYAELRFKGVERQQQDLSCGASALSTLMRHYFNIDVSEQVIVNDVLRAANPEDRAKIASSGFSMLELKHFAEMQGLVAGGFRTPKAEDLRKLRAPAIALVNSRGYKHFVVIRHVRGDEVAFADPVFGNRTEPLETFAKRWNYVILVIVAPGRVVNSAFLEAPNSPTNWRSVQLFYSRYTSPPEVSQPGELF